MRSSAQELFDGGGMAPIYATDGVFDSSEPAHWSSEVPIEVRDLWLSDLKCLPHFRSWGQFFSFYWLRL